MEARRYADGALVRVKRHAPPGHIRTPHYCKGKRGRIERLCGAYRNPELLAYGNPGEDKVPLYRVRFDSRELWPERADDPGDRVEIELYEHWLEAVEDET